MTNTYVRVIVLVIACLAVIMSIINAYNLVSANGCVDLRCRITGTRISHSQYSPYFYKWNAKDGDFFLDPNDKPGRKVNGNVVTPAVFTMFYFLAPLRYATIKSVWAILQYVFLFCSLFLLSKKETAPGKNNFLAVLLVVVCYLCSNTWFYNIERGQVYTFYLFIFSLLYRLYRADWKYGKFLSGFINAASVFVRPLIGVFLFAGMIERDKKWLLGCTCGAIAGILLFVVPAVDQWRDYFSAMKEYSYETNGQQYAAKERNDIPAVIEGETNLQKSRHFNCGGLSTVQYYLAAKEIHTNTASLSVGFLLAAAVCSVLYLRKRSGILDEDSTFLFTFFLYILSELFVIGYRGGYNQVEWIFGVFLLYRQKHLPLLPAVLIPVAIVLENIPIKSVRYQFEFAEILLICMLFYFIAVQQSAGDIRARKT